MYNIDSHVFIYTYIYIVCHVVTGCFQPFGGESLYLDSSLIILFSEAAGAWFSRAAGSQSQHAATLAYLLEKFMVIPTVCSKKSWNPDPFHVIIMLLTKKNGCTGDMSDCFPTASPHCNQQLLAKAAAHRLYLERSNPPTIFPLVMEVAILRQPATSWGTTRPKPPKNRNRNPPTHQHSYNHSSPRIPTFPMTRALPVWQAAARAVSWELLRWWRSAWKHTTAVVRDQPSRNIHEVSVKVWDEKW